MGKTSLGMNFLFFSLRVKFVTGFGGIVKYTKFFLKIGENVVFLIRLSPYPAKSLVVD